MRNTHFPGRSVVMGTRAMAATSQPLATYTALDVLRGGGNALDAAIAAAAVLGVVEPYSTSIGGDCFLFYHEAATDRLHALNGSGWAPQAAVPDAYFVRGCEGAIPATGILSVTVPGAIDAWCTAHEKLGRAEFAQLLQPAIHFAEQGFAVAPVVAANWQGSVEQLRATPDAARTYLRDGHAPLAGSVHRQPALASTLKLIAEGGRDAFYQGSIAERIVRFSDSLDGLLGLDDFAEFRSQWVEPISTVYRDHRIFEIPPNGQGIAVLMALNFLTQSNVAELQHLGPEHVHLLAEAFSMAIAERDRFVSDQEFSKLPVDELLGEAFAQSQWQRFDAHHALPQPMMSAFPNHADTVYLTVVDEDRNACSFINSTFSTWGSGLVAGDTGISLQNRGSGFVLEAGHYNCVAPRKRPLHTIIPAMVYRDDRPVLSFGVMGGHYQAMGHTYVMSNWLDFGFDLQEALDAPRFMLYEEELRVEQGVPAETRARLQSLGHNLVPVEKPLGGGQAIFIDWQNGTLHGASDPRKDGCALGY
jgi:gamma-glutamyltranspeptidase/glutathione hydrolase